MIKRIRKKLYEIEKGLEKEEQERRQQHAKELKGIKKYFKKLQEKIKINYYKPIRTKSDFNSNYVEYESSGGEDKNLSSEDYLNIIRPFLRNMINNRRTHGERKIQLVMRINFISSLDTREICTMHSKSDYGEF